jgi:hypothetical protein
LEEVLARLDGDTIGHLGGVVLVDTPNVERAAAATRPVEDHGPDLDRQVAVAPGRLDVSPSRR